MFKYLFFGGVIRPQELESDDLAGPRLDRIIAVDLFLDFEVIVTVTLFTSFLVAVLGVRDPRVRRLGYLVQDVIQLCLGASAKIFPDSRYVFLKENYYITYWSAFNCKLLIFSSSWSSLATLAIWIKENTQLELKW